MTVYLFNNSKTKSLSLRYGNGMQKLIQIAPGKSVEMPSSLTKGLLASYLNLFKGDLRVVKEIPEEVKDETAQENTTPTQVSEEENEKEDGEESSNDESSNEGDNQTGTADTEVEGDDNGTETTENASGDGDNSEENNSTDGDGEQPSTTITGESEETSESSDESAVEYTEKQLNKMNAEEVKELATSLGIDFEDDTTKKALVAVILSKQEEK